MMRTDSWCVQPHDSEDRPKEQKKAQGIGYSNITNCCTKVCPEDITITGDAVIPLKERVTENCYDRPGWRRQ